MLRRALAISLLIPSLLTSLAAAQPAVRPEIQTDCPDRESMARALSPWVNIAEDGGFSLRITRAGGTSRLDLRDPDGASSTSRSISSDDCAALAEAFALIVQARFVELAMLPPEAVEEPEAPPDEPEQPEETNEPDEVESSDDSEPADSSQELAPPPETPSAPVSSTRFLLAIGGGALLSVDPLAGAGLGRLQLELEPASWPLGLRLDAQVRSPTSQSLGEDSVDLLSFGLELAATLRLGEGPWALLGLGVGALFTRVSSDTIEPAFSELRIHPTVSLSGALALQLAGPLRLRLGGRAALLPIGDSYKITEGTASSEVGRSPLLELSVEAAVVLSFPQ